jgi:hypothetical protein
MERALPGGASACPDGAICLYENPDRGGRMLVLRAGAWIRDVTASRCATCSDEAMAEGDAFGGQVSSWENLSAIPTCYYEKPKFEGPPHLMPGHVFHNLSPGETMTIQSTSPCPLPPERRPAR